MNRTLSDGISSFVSMLIICGLFAYFNHYPPLDLMKGHYNENKDMFFKNNKVRVLDENLLSDDSFDGNGELVKMRFTACRTTKKFWRGEYDPANYRVKNTKCDLTYIVKNESGKYRIMKREGTKFFKYKESGWGIYGFPVLQSEIEQLEYSGETAN